MARLKDDNYYEDELHRIKTKKRKLGNYNNSANERQIKANLDKQARSAKRSSKQHLRRMLQEERYDEV